MLHETSRWVQRMAVYISGGPGESLCDGLRKVRDLQIDLTSAAPALISAEEPSQGQLSIQLGTVNPRLRGAPWV